MRPSIGIGLVMLLAAGPLVTGALPAGATGVETSGVDAAVAGNNAFACRLFREPRREEGNLLLAPLSIRTALAMTYGGARSQTATQMEEALCLGASGEAVHQSLNSLSRSLLGDPGGGGNRMTIANALWGHRGCDFRAEFLDLATRSYDAYVAEVDFAGAGETLSMLILLPEEPGGLPRLEEALTAEFLEERLAGLREQELMVFLPRFEASSRFHLKQTLISLGMKDAFCKGADFSGMTEYERLFIDEVIPEAYVKVDEHGTEAAGGTVVRMKKGGRAFRATHPFLFLIRDRVSGAILFIGRLTDPTRVPGK
ncbi:MAG: serpin family protein [Planctomycetota bacterium]